MAMHGVHVQKLIEAKNLKVFEVKPEQGRVAYKIKFENAVCSLEVHPDEAPLTLCMRYNDKVPIPSRVAIVLYIIELNKSIFGNFEMNIGDGQVTYKVIFDGSTAEAPLVALCEAWDCFIATFRNNEDLMSDYDWVNIDRSVKNMKVVETTKPNSAPKLEPANLKQPANPEDLKRGTPTSEDQTERANNERDHQTAESDPQPNDLPPPSSGAAGPSVVDAGAPPVMTPIAAERKSPEIVTQIKEAILGGSNDKTSFAFGPATIASIGEVFLIQPGDITFDKQGGKRVCIGRGAFGVVFRGHLYGSNMFPVAIKQLTIVNNAAYEDFKKEALMMKNLQHENIVTFYGVTIIDGKVCVVTQLCNQGSLSEYLDRHRPGLPKLVSLAIDAAKVMEFVHRKGVVHRDLKPGNILMHDGHIKLADFGITVFQHQLDDQSAAPAGTLLYMAPEVINSQKLTNKIDVYAFGIMLWQLLHPGQAAYVENNDVRVFLTMVIRGVRPVISSKINPELVKLMASCWDHNPETRPPFSEVLSTLKRVQNNLQASGCILM